MRNRWICFILSALLASTAASSSGLPPPPPSAPPAGPLSTNTTPLQSAGQEQPSPAGTSPPAAAASTDTPTGDNDDLLKEQLEEMPLLNLKEYDPVQMVVCDDILTADDIYTSMVAVMVRVENSLRDYALAKEHANLQKVLGLHAKPMIVKSLYGKLERRPVAEQKKHPIVARYIDTMSKTSEKLIAFAEGGFYDHRLMMKMVRVSMKMLANKLACQEVALDMAKNRFGWPSKFGSKPATPDTGAETATFGMGSVGGVAPSTKDPNDPGSVPFTRWSAKFMDPKPDKWPWNGWAWMANNEPAQMTDANRGTQGDQTKYNVPNSQPAK